MFQEWMHLLNQIYSIKFKISAIIYIHMPNIWQNVLDAC